MGRATSGVTGMKFRGDDELLAMAVARDDLFVFVVTELGYAKRTKIGSTASRARGGLGIKVAKLTEERGDLVGALTVSEEDEVLVVMQAAASCARASTRCRQGPRHHGRHFARPETGDRIIAVARNVERVIDEEVEAEEVSDATTDGADDPLLDTAGAGDDQAAAEGADEAPIGGAPVEDPGNDPVAGAAMAYRRPRLRRASPTPEGTSDPRRTRDSFVGSGLARRARARRPADPAGDVHRDVPGTLGRGAAPSPQRGGLRAAARASEPGPRRPLVDHQAVVPAVGGRGIALVVATAVIWSVLDGMGVFTDLNGLLKDVVGNEVDFDLLDYVGFGKVLSLATVIAVVDVVLLTALSTIVAFLYNVSAALVGGLHVTLSDD